MPSFAKFRTSQSPKPNRIIEAQTWPDQPTNKNPPFTSQPIRKETFTWQIQVFKA